MQRVCVFCGSSAGARREYAGAATAMGRELARRGVELVYGGGAVGLMGILADAVLADGGRVTGVIPDALVAREVAHRGLTSLEVVPTMHVRKARMAELADAFVALPGGFGTFDELFEIVTWAMLGIHAKPVGVLDVAGYFGALEGLVDAAVAGGFVRDEQRGFLLTGHADPAALLDALAAHRPPAVKKWATLEET